MRTRRRGLLVTALLALCALVPVLGRAQVAPPQQISVDPFAGGPGQHETAVEPDSLSVGDTVVSVFQVGRIVDGGASGIGWATSTDGGARWTNGVLPELTTLQLPPGAASRVSDPVIAYDRVHGVWLASVLALRDASPLPTTSLVVSRSGDGRSWSGPVLTARDEGRFAHDKNWIVCDNGRASRFAGTCYVAWTAAGIGLAVSRSTDGGSTWSAPTLAPEVTGYGFVPVVRPDGTLVVVYTTQQAIMAARSVDGGRSFAAPRLVTTLLTSPVPGMRAPALPTAEVDAAGRVTVAWQDCRFRGGCPQASAPNDIVYASSVRRRHASSSRTSSQLRPRAGRGAPPLHWGVRSRSRRTRRARPAASSAITSRRRSSPAASPCPHSPPQRTPSTGASGRACTQRVSPGSLHDRPCCASARRASRHCELVPARASSSPRRSQRPRPARSTSRVMLQRRAPGSSSCATPSSAAARSVPGASARPRAAPASASRSPPPPRRSTSRAGSRSASADRVSRGLGRAVGRLGRPP